MTGGVSLKSKLMAEFIGTFFLSLTICTAAIRGSAGEYAPFAIAATLMVMIYAVGHISGAHFNPAVTLAVWLRGSFERQKVLPYVFVQIVAGLVAAFSSQLIAPDSQITPLELQTVDSITAEFLYTFALVFVILNVATHESTDGNSYYGAAISFVVLAGAITVGGISGGSFNPAVTGSMFFSDFISFADLWIHLVPQIAASLSATFTFLAIQD